MAHIPITRNNLETRLRCRKVCRLISHFKSLFFLESPRNIRQKLLNYSWFPEKFFLSNTISAVPLITNQACRFPPLANTKLRATLLTQFDWYIQSYVTTWLRDIFACGNRKPLSQLRPRAKPPLFTATCTLGLHVNTMENDPLASFVC